MADIDEKALEAAARAINAGELHPFDWDAMPVNFSGKIICRCQALTAIRAYEQARAPSPDVVEIMAIAAFNHEYGSINGTWADEPDSTKNYWRESVSSQIAALQAAGCVIRKENGNAD